MVDKVKGLSGLQVQFQRDNVTGTNVRKNKMTQYCMQKNVALLNCSGFCSKTTINLSVTTAWDKTRPYKGFF